MLFKEGGKDQKPGARARPLDPTWLPLRARVLRRRAQVIGSFLHVPWHQGVAGLLRARQDAQSAILGSLWLQGSADCGSDARRRAPGGTCRSHRVLVRLHEPCTASQSSLALSACTFQCACSGASLVAGSWRCGRRGSSKCESQASCLTSPGCE